MDKRGLREATTRGKVTQVILGLFMFVIFTLLALAVLVYMVKAGHLGQGAA